jgi:hypothetical protein
MADLESGVECSQYLDTGASNTVPGNGWQPNWGQQKCAQPISDETIHLQNMLRKMCIFAHFPLLNTRIF